jgi:DNA-binding transcriptional regulator PaaX
MSQALRDEIVRELERAHPGTVTLRSLRSLVADGEYAREEVRDAVADLEADGRVTVIEERGLTRYRLAWTPERE